MFPEIMDYNHKTIDEDGDHLKINAKVFSKNISEWICRIYKLVRTENGTGRKDICYNSKS